MDDQYTNIAIVVFEDEDGSSVEMTIIDEFDHDGVQYAALVEACEPQDEGDEISFFSVTQVDGEEEFEPVEQEALFETLAGILEDRLIAREQKEK